MLSGVTLEMGRLSSLGGGWTAALGGLSPRKKVYHRGLGKRKPPTGKGMVFSSGVKWQLGIIT